MKTRTTSTRCIALACLCLGLLCAAPAIAQQMKDAEPAGREGGDTRPAAEATEGSLPAWARRSPGRWNEEPGTPGAQQPMRRGQRYGIGYEARQSGAFGGGPGGGMGGAHGGGRGMGRGR
ncbi:MAG: hypothetical protein HY778_17370 [Betaproteobacteria bacterium]|nr:hypothetical protein [Betaproteobacteria bacterium]